jgi:citrate lyase beta subunit
MMPLPRSLLFVPAHVEKMIAKALGLDPDAVVLDLEDSVPLAQKEAARIGARHYLGERPGHAFARINPLDSRTAFSVGSGLADIAAVVTRGLRGIVLPKAESAEDIAACDEALRTAERSAEVRPDSVELYAIIETARGVQAAPRIAAAATARPLRLCFGAGDFTTDVGVEWTRDEEESRVARSLVVIAARAAGLPQPVDSAFTDITDLEGLRNSALAAKRLGYYGKFVIHPSQLDTVNEVFSPSNAELVWARKVMTALATAERSGAGAFVVDGKMIDYPIVERAKRLLEFEPDASTR